VFGDVMGIDGHDDAAEAITGETPHILLGPKGAISANHRVDASFGGIPGHGTQVFVHERFAAYKKQVSNVVFEGNIDDITGFLKGDAAALFRVEAVDGKAAKIAFGVANIGDGELQIARTAMSEDVAGEFGPAVSPQDDVPRRFRFPHGRLWPLGRIEGGGAHD